jgi:hypothetical protein
MEPEHFFHSTQLLVEMNTVYTHTLISFGGVVMLSYRLCIGLQIDTSALVDNPFVYFFQLSTVCISMLFYIVGCEVNLSSLQTLHQACSQAVNTSGAVASSMGAYMYILVHSYMYIMLYYNVLCVYIYIYIYMYIYIYLINV